MGWTKQQFIDQAFNEIGLASYVYDLQPEQLNTALLQLDSMIANWNGKGIRLGYPFPSFPEDSTIASETNVPDSANEAIYTNLAIKIAPSYGKVISPDTKMTAKDGYQTLLSRATIPNEMQLPGTMPAGAGQKSWRYREDPFLNNPQERLAAGSDNTISFN